MIFTNPDRVYDFILDTEKDKSKLPKKPKPGMIAYIISNGEQYMSNTKHEWVKRVGGGGGGGGSDDEALTEEEILDITGGEPELEEPEPSAPIEDDDEALSEGEILDVIY